MNTTNTLAAVLLLALSCGEVFSADSPVVGDYDFSEITIKATRVANQNPASSYATAATIPIGIRLMSGCGGGFTNTSKSETAVDFCINSEMETIPNRAASSVLNT